MKKKFNVLVKVMVFKFCRQKIKNESRFKALVNIKIFKLC